MDKKPTTQLYSSYTQEDFEVWKILFDRQMKNLENNVSLDFLEALERVKFRADKIPDFIEVNGILQKQTGWGLHTVPNISAQPEFFNLLAQRKFTATCWLRSKQQLDYLEEPDMFHDVFAHTPLLSNDAYCKFFKAMGDLAMKHINNPTIIEKLGRLYWFTIEFGMIYENRNMKVYGAGIISSSGETKNALSNKVQKFDFSIEKVFNTDFRTDILQDKYFVIDSFEELLAAVPKIELAVEELTFV
ncbi:MAG: phenylalanine 4-monooxygenase [Bacteroidia bacterium]